MKKQTWVVNQWCLPLSTVVGVLDFLPRRNTRS